MGKTDRHREAPPPHTVGWGGRQLDRYKMNRDREIHNLILNFKMLKLNNIL